MVTFMDVWIQTYDNAGPGRFGYRLVFNLHEASRMRENEAIEAINGAGREWPEYAWNAVYTSEIDRLIVGGMEK
jgi:hypothetical protein